MIDRLAWADLRRRIWARRLDLHRQIREAKSQERKTGALRSERRARRRPDAHDEDSLSPHIGGCDAYVGAHSDGRPKGTIAGKALRLARMEAHRAFDGWWRANKIWRRAAYVDLATRMGVAVAHIGEMNEAQCRYVVEIYRGRTGQPLLTSED